MAQTATKTDCPDASVLAKYVSGSLIEARAAGLLGHLESCEVCQQKIDEMARRADSLVAAMRRPVGAPSPRDSQELDRLIATVKASHRTVNASSLSGENKSEPVSLDHFIACLSKSGLSSSDEIASWVRECSPQSSLDFANQLVERGILTPLQARALLRGRWRQLVLGDYAVLEMLGQGGMSRVYRARHLQTNREVCIKLLHPKGPRTAEHGERFEREIKTITSLKHPNIVVAHASGEAEDVPYLVMELLDGSDLAKVVAAEGPLPVDTAVRYLLQVARALAYAHSRGVIHRDIKPHNLFLDYAGKIKILDLGLARIDSLMQPEDESGYSTMTKTGMVVGTVDYIAPEQALNPREADYRSDIYSLGCTLHYLLTGRPVYSGETLMARLVAHREDPVPNLLGLRDGISREVNAVFQRMIAKRPADRYHSMTELAADLESLLAGKQPAANWQPPIQQPIPLEPVEEAEDTLADFGASTWETFPATETFAAPLPELVRPPAPSRSLLIPKPVLMWAGIGAASLAGIVLLAVVASAFLPDIGSSGQRAVVVVSPDRFNSAHYHAVTAALSERDIPFVTASMTRGMAKGDDGKKVKVDLAIADYLPKSSDAVILCGGNVHPLKKTDLVDKSLKRGAVVLGVAGDGFEPLHGKWKAAGARWDDKPSGGEVVQVGNGYISKACTKHDVPKMVDHVFTKLVK